MANTRRNALVVIGAVSMSGLWAAPADAQDAPTAIVRIDNHAMVPAIVLEQAKQRTADVYKMIGVRVSFLDERQAIQDQAVVNYTIVFLPSPTVGLDVA